jgi:hypothetical protein
MSTPSTNVERDRRHAPWVISDLTAGAARPKKVGAEKSVERCRSRGACFDVLVHLVRKPSLIRLCPPLAAANGAFAPVSA